MRATLTLDADVADYLKTESRLRDKPFTQVVNETLRRGMLPKAIDPERSRFRVEPIRGGFLPGVDRLRLNQLNDQLEVDDFIEKSAR